MEEASLPKGYQPADVEQRWYAHWNEKQYFVAGQLENRPAFSMVIPPPNVTGVLHMGHALNNTLQDILARYRRMDGFNVLWVPGTDHAGIATQNVVEKMLAAEGSGRHQLGRTEFMKRVWRWKSESGGAIINQLKRLGASCDWSRERFTMDEGLSRAVKQVFLQLFKEGLIQRDNRLINWCPRCGTALSDLEVEYEERDGFLYHIRYPAKDGTEGVVVATTRPETMLGDTAVAVHPDDERLSRLVGHMVELPLTGRFIPVIADTMVDREFGTGAVKVTPAHDFNDEATGRRHGLPFMAVIDRNGTMCGDIPAKYKGMTRQAARSSIVDDLEAAGLLVMKEPHKHNVGGCYRCKETVEPLLTLQWFVRIKTLAEPAIAAVREGRIRIIPEQWQSTYFNWMENIQDWCISRQIWWGHQIPIYYCRVCDAEHITGAGESILVGEGATPIPEGEPCPICGATDLEQDPDVLDTWFSSGLWPFTTLGWPEKTPDLQRYYPTSVLVTGFDILFFWVARMIMMGLKFMGDVPFRDVYIHALVRDAKGQKMSKSKGNVIDPLVIIDKYGTDAFRFTLAALAAQGRDVKLDEQRIEGYRHFVNKLWNAARFTLTNLQDWQPKPGFTFDTRELHPFDLWILARLNQTISAVRDAYDNYFFDDAAGAIYRFLWNDFCDWYIELSKQRIDDETVKHVLCTCMVTALKLLHPIMPFVTEEIYHKFPHDADSIMIDRFPVPDPSLAASETPVVESFIESVRAIRNIKSEMNIPPSARPAVTVVSGDARHAGMAGMIPFINTLARCEASFVTTLDEKPAQSALAVADGMSIWVHLAGIIDVTTELARIGKEIGKVQKDVEFVNKRLANDDYIAHAPADVVEKERQKLTGYLEKLGKLNESKAFLEGAR